MFSSPLFWLVVLVIAIVALITTHVYEKRVLYPRWLAAEKVAEEKSPLTFYGYYRSPRFVQLIYIGAFVLGCIGLIATFTVAASHYKYASREIELSVKTTALTEDGTRYVILDYDPDDFAYVCGETDKCEGLHAGDSVIYTKYVDDHGTTHRINLHRK